VDVAPAVGSSAAAPRSVLSGNQPSGTEQSSGSLGVRLANQGIDLEEW
jgi:hypothetical protein